MKRTPCRGRGPRELLPIGFLTLVLSQSVIAEPRPVASVALEAELRRDVAALATDIGVRNIGRGDSLARAERFVVRELGATGLTVVRKPYNARGHEVANLVAEVRGASRVAEIVVIGAHYDTAITTPGANDNASGTAALLALARRFASAKPERTVRFVAFTNEEPGFFQTDLMGSRVYARACRKRGDAIVAMISLETIGYFSDEPDSQHYPPALAALHPSTGNFIAFVGNTSARDLVERTAKSFRRASDFPCEIASLPDALPGVGWSDQWSFWQEGYSAMMITDTAPFRYPWYHRPEDTPDKVDFVRLARVVAGLEEVVRDLADPAR